MVKVMNSGKNPAKITGLICYIKIITWGQMAAHSTNLREKAAFGSQIDKLNLHIPCPLHLSDMETPQLCSLQESLSHMHWVCKFSR